MTVLQWLTAFRHFWFWVAPAALALVFTYSAIKKAKINGDRFLLWCGATLSTMLAMTHGDWLGPLSPLWTVVVSLGIWAMMFRIGVRHLWHKQWISGLLAVAVSLVVLGGAFFTARYNELFLLTSGTRAAEPLTRIGLALAVLAGFIALIGPGFRYIRSLPSRRRKRREAKKRAKAEAARKAK